MLDLDRRGIPGALIVTHVFEEAARAQTVGLGFEPATIYVAHPIQNRTDEEIRSIADAAFGAIVAAITSS